MPPGRSPFLARCASGKFLSQSRHSCPVAPLFSWKSVPPSGPPKPPGPRPWVGGRPFLRALVVGRCFPHGGEDVLEGGERPALAGQAADVAPELQAPRRQGLL